MSHRINMAGQRFGRLLVIGMIYDGKVSWSLCKCDCGKEKTIRSSNLQRGYCKSCGCLRKQALTINKKVHGDYGSKEYLAWCSMKRRCLNKNSKDFKDYGGRGIIICDRWLTAYSYFLEDMGRKPSFKHSLDRINVNGNYCIDNCRWVTADVQANNCRSNRNITYNGETFTVSQWIKKLGVKQSDFYSKRHINEPRELIIERFYKKVS